MKALISGYKLSMETSSGLLPPTIIIHLPEGGLKLEQAKEGLLVWSKEWKQICKQRCREVILMLQWTINSTYSYENMVFSWRDYPARKQLMQHPVPGTACWKLIYLFLHCSVSASLWERLARAVSESKCWEGVWLPSINMLREEKGNQQRGRSANEAQGLPWHMDKW